MAMSPTSQLRQNRFLMESRVIENDDTSGVDFFQKDVFKPIFKKHAVCRSTVLHWGYPLTPTKPRNDVGTLKLFPADVSDDFLSSKRIRILSIQVLIYPALINVYKVLRRDSFQSLKKLISRTYVYSLVECCFFYGLFSTALMPFESRIALPQNEQPSHVGTHPGAPRRTASTCQGRFSSTRFLVFSGISGRFRPAEISTPKGWRC